MGIINAEGCPSFLSGGVYDVVLQFNLRTYLFPCRVVCMYVPDGVDDVGAPVWVIDIIQQKQVMTVYAVPVQSSAMHAPA